MTEDKRHEIVSEIYTIAKEKGLNQSTLAFLMSTMTDKKLVEFHTEFINKTNKDEDGL